MDATVSSAAQRWARRRAARLRVLYAHGLVSLVLAGIVVLVDAVASRDSTWAHWPPLAGVGRGLDGARHRLCGRWFLPR